MGARPGARIPASVKLAILTCIAGVTFPIYGLPLGPLKLTGFRLGLGLLFPLTALYGVKPKTRIAWKLLLIMGLFWLWRVAGLVLLSDQRSLGMKQLAWYFEGFCFVLALTCLSGRFSNLWNFFVRSLFWVGGASVLIIAVQSALLYLDIAWVLPLSTSRFGFSEAYRPWTYPFLGGQVLGAFFEPNMAGSMCAFFVAMLLPGLITRRDDLGIGQKKLLLLITLAAVGSMATGSRQSMLAIAIIAALNLWRSKGAPRAVVIAGWLVLGVFGLRVLDIQVREELTVMPETASYRMLRGIAEGDVTGGRLRFMRIAVANLPRGAGLLFGTGEGTGIHATHNAFLIVLSENGFVGVGCLVWLLMLLFLFSLREAVTRPRHDRVMRGLSCLGVIVTWFCLITVNWAQLNQQLSFVFLAFPLLLANIPRPAEAEDSR